MKKFIILMTLVLAFPLFAAAEEDGTIYSINGYAHFGNHNGFGADLGVTFHTRPDSFFSPIFFCSFGYSGFDDAYMLDLKLMGGVSWHLTGFFYADLQGGVQGYMYGDTDKPFGLGGSIITDASILLHLAEIIGLRAGCSVSWGTAGAMISPHIGLASMFDFSWLFGSGS